MTEPTTQPRTPALTGERADLLEQLGKARHFLRFTVRELTDEQAASAPRRASSAWAVWSSTSPRWSSAGSSSSLEGPSAMPDFDTP